MTHGDSTARHKARLRNYFEGVGFERWRAIYGEEQLSAVRQSIREGHRRMLALLYGWLDELNLPPGAHLLDAGCGTGLLSVALAQRGYTVTAVDISSQMVQAAAQRAQAAGVAGRMHFLVSDLETVGGSYDAVACLDVLIHYPEAAFGPMCAHLARRSRGRLFFTHAPYNRLLAAMHWLGGYFPKSQRRTDIQMIRDNVVRQSLAEATMQVQRSAQVNHGFYFVRLVQAG